jgi:hypothetical protein
VVTLSEEEMLAHGRDLCAVLDFRPAGVAAGPAGARRWILVRPGVERPLACLPGSSSRRLVLVFDLNGVLGAKWFDAGGRFRLGRHCHARTGPLAFVLRPGAPKLLRMCEAAGHEVWIWSTMQRVTVDAFGRAVAPWLPPGRLLCGDECGAEGEKDLRRVWARTALAGEDVASRTLLFDDDVSKGRLQPGCVREVPRFEPEGPYDLEAVSDAGAREMLLAVARAQAS